MKSFNEVWEDISTFCQNGVEIRTITQNMPNEVLGATEQGIRVRTKFKPELVKREWIETGWNALLSLGEISANDLTGAARYRSSFILALLSQLRYVEIKSTRPTAIMLKYSDENEKSSK